MPPWGTSAFYGPILQNAPRLGNNVEVGSRSPMEYGIARSRYAYVWVATVGVVYHRKASALKST